MHFLVNAYSIYRDERTADPANIEVDDMNIITVAKFTGANGGRRPK